MTKKDKNICNTVRPHAPPLHSGNLYVFPPNPTLVNTFFFSIVPTAQIFMKFDTGDLYENLLRKSKCG